LSFSPSDRNLQVEQHGRIRLAKSEPHPPRRALRRSAGRTPPSASAAAVRTPPATAPARFFSIQLRFERTEPTTGRITRSRGGQQPDRRPAIAAMQTVSTWP